MTIPIISDPRPCGEWDAPGYREILKKWHDYLNKNED